MSVRNRAWLDPLVLLDPGVIHIPSWTPDFISVLWDAFQVVSSNWMDLVPLSENCVTVVSWMVTGPLAVASRRLKAVQPRNPGQSPARGGFSFASVPTQFQNNTVASF